MDEICYREYPVPTALAPFVKLIWSLECDRPIHGAEPERILPDGCVELVFHFGDPFCTAFANKESYVQPQGFFVGQMNEFIEIAPHGKVGFVAVRFSAQGAYRFLPRSLKRIAGGIVATRDIWRDSDSEITDRIATAPTMNRRVAIINDLLNNYLALTQREDILVDRALELIRLHGGALRIAELASAVGASMRQLNRRFESAVGVSPKQFSRVSRFAHALNELRSHRNTTLTEVALNCGYFDQAHFNHEFRQFAGFQPTELLHAQMWRLDVRFLQSLKSLRLYYPGHEQTSDLGMHCLSFTTSFALFRLSTEARQPETKTDPWKPLRVFIGKWEGEVKGEPGTGKAEREYSFVLNERFIQIVNRSTYPPQEKNPRGEKHEDIAFFSYDKSAKKFVLRQFHIEGFVNQFNAESISEDGRTIVFVSTAIENIAPGWRARETYRILGDSEFVETFALAEPNQDFKTYSDTYFRRASR